MITEVELSFITSVNNIETLGRHLLSSPCFRERKASLVAYFNTTSAAQAFNRAVASFVRPSSAQWLVWVHEDVHLPSDWDVQFKQQIQLAQQKWPRLGVVGVYGTRQSSTGASPVGHVLDRGKLLKESQALPCLVDSLDELLFAVRLETGLRLDPKLNFDFYATDLVLQAQEKHWDCAVVDAYCEHWSGTAQVGPQPLHLTQRIKLSAEVFEHKWAHNMPITTSCFQIDKPGDVATYIDSLTTK